MKHKVAGRGLSRSTGHRKALFRNQVTDLLDYEKIRTTEAKAKEIRAIAEKIITLGKKAGWTPGVKCWLLYMTKRWLIRFLIMSPQDMPSVMAGIPVLPGWDPGWEMEPAWPR